MIIFYSFRPHLDIYFFYVNFSNGRKSLSVPYVAFSAGIYILVHYFLSTFMNVNRTIFGGNSTGQGYYYTAIFFYTTRLQACNISYVYKTLCPQLPTVCMYIVYCDQPAAMQEREEAPHFLLLSRSTIAAVTTIMHIGNVESGPC